LATRPPACPVPLINYGSRFESCVRSQLWGFRLSPFFSDVRRLHLHPFLIRGCKPSASDDSSLRPRDQIELCDRTRSVSPYFSCHQLNKQCALAALSTECVPSGMA